MLSDQTDIFESMNSLLNVGLNGWQSIGGTTMNQTDLYFEERLRRRFTEAAQEGQLVGRRLGWEYQTSATLESNIDIRGCSSFLTNNRILNSCGDGDLEF
jgi:hypothetical protein